MKNEFADYCFEVDSFLCSLELAQKNMNAILETLNQWTEDHVFINVILYCPIRYLSDTVCAMKEANEAAWEKARTAK